MLKMDTKLYIYQNTFKKRSTTLSSFVYRFHNFYQNLWFSRDSSDTKYIYVLSTSEDYT